MNDLFAEQADTALQAEKAAPAECAQSAELPCGVLELPKQESDNSKITAAQDKTVPEKETKRSLWRVVLSVMALAVIAGAAVLLAARICGLL